MTLEELLAVLAVEPAAAVDTFVARTPAAPQESRVFGGMIIGQALAATVETVPEDVPLHSLHAWFLRPMLPGRPSEVTVERIRDGRSFVTRQAVVAQDGRELMRMTSSFHRPEEGDEYQLSMPADLSQPSPDFVPDPPLWRTPTEETWPFEMADLGATPQRSDGTYESTRRVWVRVAPETQLTGRQAEVLLAYLSDMTGASFRPHSLGTWGTHTDASLDHGFWLHRPVDLTEWFLFDYQAIVNTGARSVIRSTLFDGRGRLCGSMAQEILIRELARVQPTKEAAQ